MKNKLFVSIITCVTLFACAGRSQTGGGAAPATGGQGQTGGGAAGQTTGGNQKGGLAPGVNPNQTLPPNAPGIPPGLPNREQLPVPPAPAIGGSNVAGLQGVTNQVGGSNRFALGTNQLPRTNQFGFTNRFGTNHFGFTNRFGTNEFGFTNRFGSNRFAGFTNRFGTNGFRGTNDFGFRTNRFGTNGFGHRTNRFVTNEFGFTNSVDISNEIELGLSPGAVVTPGGGGIATAVPAVANPAAAPTPNPERPATLPGNPVGTSFGTGALTTNRSGFALRDQSVTEADRTLLQNLRKLVVPRLEAMGAFAPAVHFWVRDGLVTLVGTVDSTETRQEAGRMVQEIPGVLRVEDRLYVGAIDKNASDVDRSLAYEVRDTVLPAMAVNGTAPPIDFSVRDGIVTVTGTAASTEEATRVVKMVQQVPGVGEVKNRLIVGTSGAGNNGTVTVESQNPSDTTLTPTGRPEPPPQQPVPPPTDTQKPQ